MANQFLPSRELPYLAKLGTSGVMISDDLASQDDVFEQLDRLSVRKSKADSPKDTEHGKSRQRPEYQRR